MSEIKVFTIIGDVKIKKRDGKKLKNEKLANSLGVIPKPILLNGYWRKSVVISMFVQYTALKNM